MTTVRLTRKNEYMNRFRNYRIYIDGNKVGEIGNNEEKTYEVSEGAHTICAKIDWTSSPEQSFTASGNAIAFTVGGFKGFRWLSLAVVVVFIARIPVEKLLGTTVMIVMELLILAAFAYVLIVNRKKFLELKQEDISSDYVPYSGK